MLERLGLCCAGLCCALLALSTGALAQSKGSAGQPASTLWDHNGSVVYLLAQGAAREIHYKEPRAGMAEAGARPGALLFRGMVANGQFAGTAFIFDRLCGQLPYSVSGPILDHDERVVLTGEAPLVGAKCRVQGHFTQVLEFRLQSANKAARTITLEDAPAAPLRETQSPPPTPPAVVAAAAPAPKAAPAPPPAPAVQNPSVVVDSAQAKAAAAPPRPSAAQAPPAVVVNAAAAKAPAASAPPTAQTQLAVAVDATPAKGAAAPAAQIPPAIVADTAPAPKAAAPPPPRSSTPAPDLTAEIERTRAARVQAAEAAQAAELAAHRASAEAEAARAAAEAHMQQSRDELRATREENSEERSRQYLILAAMLWMLLLSGAAIVLLFARLRRSQSAPKTENAKTEDVSAATMTDSSFYSRLREIVPRVDATSAAKSHGYQSGGRVRVFFQTRATPHSGSSSTLRRVGYVPR